MRVLSVYETIIRDLKHLDDNMLIMVRAMISTSMRMQNEESSAHLFNYDIEGNLLDSDEFIANLNRISDRMDRGEDKSTSWEDVKVGLVKKLEIAGETGKWPPNKAKPTGEFEVLNSFTVPERSECYLLGRIRQGSLVVGAKLEVPLNSSLSFRLLVSKVEIIEVNGYPEIDKLITLAPEEDVSFIDNKELMMMLNICNEKLSVINPEGALESE